MWIVRVEGRVRRVGQTCAVVSVAGGQMSETELWDATGRVERDNSGWSMHGALTVRCGGCCLCADESSGRW